MSNQLEDWLKHSSTLFSKDIIAQHSKNVKINSGRT